MNYNMDYDLAAFFIILSIILHFLIKKNIQTRQTKIFQSLMYFGLVAALLNLFTVYAFEWISTLPSFFNYFFNILYLMSFNSLTPIYFYYICSTLLNRSEFKFTWKLMIIIPISFIYLLISTTGITKWIFYFNESNVYTHGPLMLVLYIVAVYYLLCCIVFVLKYHQRFSMAQRIAVYFFTGTAISAVILQFTILSKVMISEFATALSILMIYLSLEDPDDYIDKRIGTYNRNAIVKLISSYLDTDKKFSILGVQIVGFKFINDTIGDDNGDILLRQVVDTLNDVAMKNKVFRISGTRYAIVSEHHKTDWQKEVTTIKERFAKSFTIQNQGLSLDVLMCVVNCPEEAHTLKDIMATLECTYTDFKKAGDNGLITLSETIREKLQRENQLLRILRQAIQDKNFEMYYQPIYSVREKRFTCAEALLRLKNDELGYISPEEFIPLAEKNGLILEIGEFVFRDVCKFIASNNLKPLGIHYIEINLSVMQCMQENLHKTLLRIIDEYKIPYDCINLEITETSAVVSSETLKSNMTALVSKGVTFALDDYGTGYSTTSTLTKYPFHIIKLDKSMIWSSFEDQNSQTALKYTIAMIKEMQMNIVAEGVETLEQANQLITLGCDYFQGYYYSRPVPAQKFLELLQHSRQD